MRKYICAMALFAVIGSAQQAIKPDTFKFHVHIPLTAVPTSQTTALLPVDNAGNTIAPGVSVDSFYFVNTNSSTVVTVIATCIGSSVVLVDAAIPGVAAGGNNIPVQLPEPIWCAGGVKWVASATGLNGTMAGRY